MADPIIQSVTPNYPQGGGKFPGQQMSIDVVATDADAHTIDMTLRVTDSSGNSTTGTYSFVQTDPVTLEIVSVSPGHEAVIDPANPLRIWLT